MQYKWFMLPVLVSWFFFLFFFAVWTAKWWHESATKSFLAGLCETFGGPMKIAHLVSHVWELPSISLIFFSQRADSNCAVGKQGRMHVQCAGKMQKPHFKCGSYTEYCVECNGCGVSHQCIWRYPAGSARFPGQTWQRSKRRAPLGSRAGDTPRSRLWCPTCRHRPFPTGLSGTPPRGPPKCRWSPPAVRWYLEGQPRFNNGTQWMPDEFGGEPGINQFSSRGIDWIEFVIGQRVLHPRSRGLREIGPEWSGQTSQWCGCGRLMGGVGRGWLGFFEPPSCCCG